jgi:hypothetical protein
MEFTQEVLLTEESLAHEQASRVMSAVNKFVAEKAARRRRQYRRHRIRLTINCLRVVSKVAKILRLKSNQEQERKAVRRKALAAMMGAPSMLVEPQPNRAGMRAADANVVQA